MITQDDYADDMNLGEEEFQLPDTEHVEVTDSFEPLPAGIYEVEVEGTKMVRSKAGDPMLKVQLKVLEGEYANRKIFDQIILKHENPDAERIGLQRLKQLKLAVGKPSTTNEYDLWNVPIAVRVKIEHDKSGQYAPRNAVTGYSVVEKARPAVRPAVGKAPAAAKPAPAQASKQAAQRQAATSEPPWKKK